MFMLLAFTHSQVLAQAFYSGNDLVDLMREDDKVNANASGVDWLKDREYSAYIAGVCDATNIFYRLPTDATQGQIVAGGGLRNAR
jgi:hypothetical protein